MGFNATVVVLLDRLDEIERDPEFGKKLCDAIRYRSMMPAGPDERSKTGYRFAGNEATGQTQVIEVHHADQMIVVAVGGNTGQVLGYAGSYASKPDEMIDCLAASKRVRKKLAKAKR